MLTKSEATTALASNANPLARAEFSELDTTGQHYVTTRCWLEDGELVRSHPTDHRHWPIPAPEGVSYSIVVPSADEVAWREEQDRLAAAGL